MSYNISAFICLWNLSVLFEKYIYRMYVLGLWVTYFSMLFLISIISVLAVSCIVFLANLYIVIQNGLTAQLGFITHFGILKPFLLFQMLLSFFFLKRWYHPKNQGFIATKKDYVFLDWPLSLWWKSDYPWVPEITWDRIPLIDGTLAHSLLLLFCKRLAVWLFIEELLYVCFVEKKNQGVFMGCSL